MRFKSPEETQENAAILGGHNSCVGWERPNLRESFVVFTKHSIPHLVKNLGLVAVRVDRQLILASYRDFLAMNGSYRLQKVPPLNTHIGSSVRLTFSIPAAKCPGQKPLGMLIVTNPVATPAQVASLYILNHPRKFSKSLVLN